jgi:hypothetical protein
MMKYLGFRFCCLRFCKVNKKWYKMFQEVFTTGLRKPKLGEMDARDLLGILDLMRYIVYQYKVVGLSPKATSILKTVNDIFKLRQGPKMFKDLEKLNLGIYENWNNQNGNPGIISWTRDWLSINNSSKTKWEDLLERDAKYWKDSRVFGTFHVLFVRVDGTILVSVDFKKVYLVLGIVHAIDDIHSGRVVQTESSIPDFFGYVGCKCLQCRSPLISVHGTFMGKRANTTLLNWRDKIVYDGLFKIERAMTENETRKAIAVYISAVDNGSLITRLEKRIIQTAGNAIPSSSTSFRCAAGKSTSRPGGEEEQQSPRLPTPSQPNPQPFLAAPPTREQSFVSNVDLNAIKSQLHRALSLADTDTLQVRVGPSIGGLLTGEEERDFIETVSRMTCTGVETSCAMCGEYDRVEEGKQVIMTRCARCSHEYFCCQKHHMELWRNHTKICGLTRSKK